ncbi:MAG: hypothetical protein M3301_06330 [Chloroflexota bacterium]|nr:hypothetical protein [Chloroflexota bacterium]
MDNEIVGLCINPLGRSVTLNLSVNGKSLLGQQDKAALGPRFTGVALAAVNDGPGQLRLEFDDFRAAEWLD